MISPLRALLGLMPGRSTEKISAITINTTTLVVVTKFVVAMSIVTTKSWWSVGLVVVSTVTLPVVYTVVVCLR